MKRYLFPLILMFVLSPARAADRPDSLLIQAESFSGYNELGFKPITANPIGYLEGLDAAGEWTEYGTDLSAFGTWSASIRAQGADGIPFHLQLILTPVGEGDSQTVDLTFTGGGFG